MSSGNNLPSNIDLSTLPPDIRSIVLANIHQEDHQRHHRLNLRISAGGGIRTPEGLRHRLLKLRQRLDASTP